MNNNKTNGSDCSQRKDECNGYSSSREQTADPTRDQERNFQNEGSREKTDKSVVNGCVICSSEGQAVLKTQFESMEKELGQVKEEMNKLSSEKLQVSLIVKYLSF